MAVHHLLHRAAEIDVDEGGAAIGVEARRLGHHRGLAAGELHRHRLLLGRVLGHASGIGGSARIIASLAIISETTSPAP